MWTGSPPRPGVPVTSLQPLCGVFRVPHFFLYGSPGVSTGHGSDSPPSTRPLRRPTPATEPEVDPEKSPQSPCGSSLGPKFSRNGQWEPVPDVDGVRTRRRTGYHHDLRSSLQPSSVKCSPGPRTNPEPPFEDRGETPPSVTRRGGSLLGVVQPVDTHTSLGTRSGVPGPPPQRSHDHGLPRLVPRGPCLCRVSLRVAQAQEWVLRATQVNPPTSGASTSPSEGLGRVSLLRGTVTEDSSLDPGLGGATEPRLLNDVLSSREDPVSAPPLPTSFRLWTGDVGPTHTGSPS